ncbi:hypothetical protein F8388_014403 [Cannabis sativa]|uniref:Uncharacterized protein n=1 Tax=Cannabis sativa TaxID=3483 RepID=A0A7J6FY61_CANSA|nr:hypothetical protein F8388_014403 [Cannabis sativa]
MMRRIVRKCSHCGKTGHNSRTCKTTTTHHHALIRLFGVQLYSSSSNSNSHSNSSMEFLSSSSSSSSFSTTYFMDHFTEKKKFSHNNNGSYQTKINSKKGGMAWTVEEHKRFLIGLEKLGKGDWRGISTNFVHTRTSTQVASHAQKFFNRHTNIYKINRRRSSLLDMGGDKIFYKRGEKFDEKISNYTRSTYFDDVLKINHLERPIYMNNEYKYDHDDDHKHHHSSPTSHKHHHSSPTSELELKLGAPNTSNTIAKTSPQNLLFY